MIREIQLADLIRIERMHSGDFPLPKIMDPSYVSQLTICNGDEVVGAIFGRRTSELILILKNDLPRITKARLWQEAGKAIAEDLMKKGIKSAHVFADSEEYAKILESHLGFVRATGIPLYLEVD